MEQNELREALCDIRKAHRMVYAYQKLMMDLMRFINSKLGSESDFTGRKRFSNAIGRNQFTISPGMWAWDFLYSYVMEYHLGGKACGENMHYDIHVVQYTDTAGYKVPGTERTKLSIFDPEEESESKLLFVVDILPNDIKSTSSIDGLIFSGALLTGADGPIDLKNGGKRILFAKSLEYFLDEKSTMKCLRELVACCEKIEGVKIVL